MVLLKKKEALSSRINYLDNINITLKRDISIFNYNINFLSFFFFTCLQKSLRKFKLQNLNKLVYTEKGTSQLTRDLRIHGKHTFGIGTEIMYGFNGDLAKRMPQSNHVKCKSYQYLFEWIFEWYQASRRNARCSGK